MHSGSGRSIRDGTAVPCVPRRGAPASRACAAVFLCSLLSLLSTAVRAEPAAAALAEAALPLSRATMMYMAPDIPALYIGDATALYRINPGNLSITANRNISDPANCVRYDAVAFNDYMGAGESDPSFCQKEDGSCLMDECSDCKLKYFTSTCNGNQYFLMREHAVSDELLVCSAFTQCQTISKATLDDIARSDTNIEQAPRGWFCNSAVDKGFGAFLSSQLSDTTQEFCPIWRYGPIDANNIKYPQRIAASFIPDVAASGSPTVLYLAANAEQFRDHQFTDAFFSTSNLASQLTKRDPTTYSRTCDADCAQTDSYALAPEPTADEAEAETLRTRNEFLQILHDDTFIYVVMNLEHEEDGEPTVRPVVARFCRDGGGASDNGLVRSHLGCGGQALNHIREHELGPVFTTQWGEPTAFVAVSDSSLCLFSLSPTTSYASLSFRQQMDSAMEVAYGTQDCATDLGNSAPLEKTVGGTSAFATYSGHGAVTSFTVDLVHGHTVVFVGTDTGSILRTHMQGMDSPDTATVYGEANTTIHSSSMAEPVVQLEMWRNGSALFVLSSSSVRAVSPHNCSQYTTCSSCIASMDPYCGWCPLSNACTERIACASSVALDRAALSTTAAMDYWLHALDGVSTSACPTLSSLTPAQVPVGTPTTLTFDVTSLPALLPGTSWFCNVGGYAAFEAEVATTATVTCNVSIASLATGVSGYLDTTTVSLAHGASASAVTPLLFDNRENLTLPMEVYDCGVETSQGCAGCPSRCGWCAYDNTCTSGPEKCRGARVSEWLNSTAACPLVNATQPATVHAQLPTVNVSWEGINFVAPQAQGDVYTCHFTVATGLAATETTGAFVNDTLVHCPVPEESGSGLVDGTRTRSVELRFRDVPVGTAAAAPLTFYDCEALGGGSSDQDCGRCLADNTPGFQCGWCLRSSSLNQRCEYVDNCDPGVSFLPAQGGDVSACPQPEVLSVVPTTLPATGGTYVTITGRNLGRGLADIAGVSIAGTACVLTEFVVSSGTLVCRTNAFPTTETDVAAVVLLTGGQSAESAAMLQVVQPRVAGIDPPLGIRAGGALVTLTGSGLDAGLTVNVTLDQVQCQLVGRTATQVRCELQPSADTNARRRRRRSDPSSIIDGGSISTDVEEGADVLKAPAAAPPRHARGSSIGRSRGGALYRDRTMQDGVYDAAPLSVSSRARRALPEAVCVQVDGQLDGGSCSPVASGVSFEVRSNPTISSTWPARAPANATFNFVVVGTDMNAVQTATLRLLQTAEGTELAAVACAAVNASALTCPLGVIPAVTALVPDIGVTGLATRFELQADAANYSGEAMVFQPNPVLVGLQPEAAGPGDILVISGVHLTAFAPFVVYVSGAPAEVQVESENQVTVTVPDIDTGPEVPLDVTYALVDYDFNATLTGAFQLAPQASGTDVVPIAGGIAGAFVVLLVVVVVVYRANIRNRSAKEKALVKQMQDLETQVIDVARQGFTELQEGGGLALTLSEAHPRSFGEYARRVYFTSLETHPLPSPPTFPGANDCVSQFMFFLRQEDFLQTFVGAMEAEGRAFSVRDRCHVASLLMCAASGDEGLSTLMLSTLLDQYFSANARKDPRLMLRRTESVAEKLLTAWLTAGMHADVMRDAAKPLYNLTQALALYAWKGPVDAVTGVAMYTLNADALLRVRVHYEVVTLQVDMNRSMYDVVVNTCDTISQVRDKLHAVLQAASADMSDFDQRVLVLQREEGLRVLRDIDEGSETDGGWVRLNTVSFYGMNDGDQLAFVKSDDGDTRRRTQRKSTTGIFKMRTARSKSRVDPFACEPWHLAKPSEEEGAATKVPSEIFLTYLMTVKTALQPFVDDLVSAMFNVDRPCPAVRRLFHLLDEQARKHNITDPRVVHIWKSNALPLRFWVNLIKNPDFLLHVKRSRAVDSGLSTVAQVMMDSCSVSDQQLGKHSPANKHLYRKEVAAYKQKISNFYTAVSRLAPPSGSEMRACFAVARECEPACAPNSAVRGLVQYALRFRQQLVTELVAVGHKPMADDFERVLLQFVNQGVTNLSPEEEDTSYLNIVGGGAGEEVVGNRNSASIDEEMFSLEVLVEQQEEEEAEDAEGGDVGIERMLSSSDMDATDTTPMVSDFF